MNLERIIRAVAGVFILGSLALGWLVTPYWFLFTAFVGMNLLQSSITRWCLMEDLLRKAGVRGCREESAAGRLGHPA